MASDNKQELLLEDFEKGTGEIYTLEEVYLLYPIRMSKSLIQCD